MSEPKAPFITLGRHLKYVREQTRQSRAEVSGAVEIDENLLERIEAGVTRPDEEILLLLISYFKVQDQEALQLWELAEYEGELPDQLRPEFEVQPDPKAIVMLLGLDMRTMYSDGVEIDYNQAGVTLNFSQSVGQSKQSPVARVGMSYEQAEAVLRQLQQALLQAKYLKGPRALPPSTEPQEK